MPTSAATHKYSATLPLGATVQDRTEVANGVIDIFPYIVNLGVDVRPRINTAFTAIGILMHVGAWVMAFISDIVTVSHLDPGADAAVNTDKQLFDYWLASFIPLVTAFAVLAGIIFYHLLAFFGCMGTPVDRVTNPIPPSMEAVMRGGALVSAVFGFTILGFPTTGLSDPGDTQQFRNWLIISMLAKLIVLSCLQINSKALH